MQAGGNKALSFGKSKAKLLSGNAKKVTSKTSPASMRRSSTPRDHRVPQGAQKFTKLGGKIPRASCSWAPRARARPCWRGHRGEANAPFFSISGSDFVEMFVGVGASRVRDLFEQGKQKRPLHSSSSMRIDAVGPATCGAGLGGGTRRARADAQSAPVEMDGFESNDGVILVAATTGPTSSIRPSSAPAVSTAGWWSICPTSKAAKASRVHTRNIPLPRTWMPVSFARGTPGFSAPTWPTCQTRPPSRRAVRQEESADGRLRGSPGQVLMRAEVDGHVRREKRNTALSRVEHTIVAPVLSAADPLHKVTIIPRGVPSGLTSSSTEDKYSYSKRYLARHDTNNHNKRTNIHTKNQTARRPCWPKAEWGLASPRRSSSTSHQREPTHQSRRGNDIERASACAAAWS